MISTTWLRRTLWLAAATLAVTLGVPTSATRAGEAVRIGISISDGGVAWQKVADKCLQGILNSLDWYNAQMDVIGGRRVEGVVYKTAHNEPAAQAATERFLTDHPDILAIVCFGSTPMARGIARAIRRTRPCLAVFPASIDPAILDLNPLFTLFMPDYEYQAEALTAYLQTLDNPRLAVVSDARSHVQTGLGTSLARRYRAGGGLVTGIRSYSDGVVKGGGTYRALLDSVKIGEPEYVAVLGFGEEIAAAVRLAGEVGLDACFFGGISWNSDSLFAGTGSNLDGSFYLDFYLTDRDNSLVATFMDVMTRKGMAHPGLESAISWDVASLLAASHVGAPASAAEVHARFMENVTALPQVTGQAVIRQNERRILKAMRLVRIHMTDGSPSVSIIADYVPADPESRLVLRDGAAEPVPLN